MKDYNLLNNTIMENYNEKLKQLKEKYGDNIEDILESLTLSMLKALRNKTLPSLENVLEFQINSILKKENVWLHQLLEIFELIDRVYSKELADSNIYIQMDRNIFLVYHKSFYGYLNLINH